MVWGKDYSVSDPIPTVDGGNALLRMRAANKLKEEEEEEEVRKQN